MPFPNEHAARQADPSGFDSFRRMRPEGFPEGVSAIIGIKDGKSTLQSLRFNKDKFTPAEAKEWLKEHDFKTTGFEEATKPQEKIAKSFWHGVL